MTTTTDFIKDSMGDTRIWLVLLTALLSPVGFGYFTRGFIFGFKTFGLEDIFVGLFLSAPFFLVSFFSEYYQSEIERYKDKQKGTEYIYEEYSKSLVAAVFFFQAALSWSIIFIMALYWYSSGFTPLSKLTNNDWLIFASIFYTLIILRMIFAVISRKRKFEKLQRASLLG